MKATKVKSAKLFTRAQAERAMTQGGADPSTFLNMASPLGTRDPKNPEACRNHPNRHVLRKAWRLLGNPAPEGLSADDMKKFNALMGVKAPVEE